MHRRTFLQHVARTLRVSLPVGGGLGAGCAWAQLPSTAPGDGRRFLFVFLRGGLDAANVLIPTASTLYYDARPTLAVARPDASNPQAALRLNADWGLHPALRDTLLPLILQGEAVLVPYAGTHDLSRSHFETQDAVEWALPAGGARTDASGGFMNRLLQSVSGGASTGIALTDQLPTALRGPLPVANASLKGRTQAALNPHQSDLLASMYRGQTLETPVREGLALRQRLALELDTPPMGEAAFAREMQAANRGANTARGFAVEAPRIGRLLREPYRIGFVDIGGWDTHLNQGGATGALANNLQTLGEGLHNLAQSLGTAWQQTLVVVMSEFGRTFRENGTRGTDHGHGGLMMVLGGAVRGRALGPVAGQRPVPQANLLNQGRDWPVLNEYREVLGGLLKPWLGLTERQLAHVFPGARPAALQLV